MPSVDGDEYGYWAAMARAWGSPEVLVNLEHDMQYSDTLARELLDCPHPCCTHAYRMHTGRYGDYWAHSHDGLCGMDGHWVTEGAEWAAYSAIGFCKIVPEVRTVPLERCQWRHVEHVVNSAIWRATGAVRDRWHVHWPGVEHYHYADRP